MVTRCGILPGLSRRLVRGSCVIPATGLSTAYLDISNSPLAPQKFCEIKVVP